MSEALDRHPALGLLAVAVPVAIAEIAHLDTGQRLELARQCSQHVAEHGDNLMFRSAPGRSATAFAHLARGLAAAAYQPGGITFAGMHWCTDHHACQQAASQSPPPGGDARPDPGQPIQPPPGGVSRHPPRPRSTRS
jgi:hypothetical protein